MQNLPGALRRGVSPSSLLPPPPSLCSACPYLAGLLAHQGEEPEVDEVLPPGRKRLEVNHQDIGEEQEEGEVREDVHVEDDDRCREEGSEARQAAHRLQPLLPVGNKGGSGAQPPWEMPQHLLPASLVARMAQLQEVPEGDEAGVEKWEEQHAHYHPPKPIVHAHLPPPDFGQKGL